MINCGHQLGSSDDSDWLLSSSAGAPIGGSSNTVELLHSIMLDESNSDYENQSNKGSYFLQSQKICLSVSKDRQNKYLKHREDRLSNNKKNHNSFHDFSQFDEAEHFDGCPVKWLYRRQSIDSWRSSSTYKKDDCVKIERQKSTTRDKTPREIQIHKIGLRKRQGRTKTKSSRGKAETLESQTKLNEKLETHEEEKRAKLAAKLNFKPFYEDNEEEDSDDEIRFTNFLQPRPLTGQRPWLCILLAPRLDSFCTMHPLKEKIPERTRSPTVSIKSLVLPELTKARPISTPLASSASRWAGQKKVNKPEKEIKILQTPPQLIIKLRNIEDTDNQKSNPLLEEDRYYRLKRFLNINEKISDDIKIDENPVKIKKNKPKSKNGRDIQIISRKVQFFERPGKPMR